MRGDDEVAGRLNFEDIDQGAPELALPEMVGGIADHHPPHLCADQVTVEFAANLLDDCGVEAVVTAASEPLEAFDCNLACMQEQENAGRDDASRPPYGRRRGVCLYPEGPR